MLALPKPTRIAGGQSAQAVRKHSAQLHGALRESPPFGALRAASVAQVLLLAQAGKVEPPEEHICKFVPSGEYLVRPLLFPLPLLVVDVAPDAHSLRQVCFGNMQHDLVVYRYVGWDAACVGEPSEPPEGLPFDR